MSKQPDFTSLLLDKDGDGFFDALRYPISLPSNPSKNTVAAAAELAMFLSSEMLAMPEQPWTIINNGLPPATIYIGPVDNLRLLPLTEDGFHVVSNKRSLLLIADNPVQLLLGVRHFLSSLKKERGSDKKSSMARTSFGLGTLFDVPSRIIIETTDPRAVDAAARIALEQFTPLALDKQRVPKILLTDGKGMLSCTSPDDVRVAGEGLTYLAHDYPHLPGGPNSTQLEHRLNEVFILNSPHARIAALLAEQPTNGHVAYLAHPPSYAHEVFHTLVVDSSKGEVMRRWRINLPWEGQRLRERIESLSFSPGANVEIIATLGESQRVRTILADKIQAHLSGRGYNAHVVLRSTLKPALCWLHEEVLPQAKYRKADAIIITCSTWDKEGLEPASRWLRDLYPLDALLERDYPDIKLSMRTDEKQRVPYRVVALRDGHAVLQETLAPPTSERAYLPGDQRRVHPVCGWLTVRADEKVIANEALPTDAEMFWDWYQHDALPEVMSLSSQGMLFADLTVKLQISEPDDRLNVLQERLSGTEALHEDIYFVTLDAFKAASGEEPESRRLLTGRVIPVVTSREQRDTHAEITLSLPGEQETAWEDSDGNKRSIDPLSIETLISRVQVDTEAHPAEISLNLCAKDEKDALLALNRLTALHKLELAGYISPWELTLPRKVSLKISATVNDKTVRELTLPALPVDTELSPLEEVPRHNLTPHESADLTWRAGVLTYTHAALAGRSYQDRPILALELTYPSRAAQRKLALWKPTILITARQHANEISSTNAALETARNLATIEHEYLKYVNVVIVPMENPDGAYLYSELAEQNPEHLLHAARYTALGADLQTAIWQTDHPLTEGHVRRFLWSKWRPIVHVNDHGYAGHEWQQPFAGTVPYLFPSWSLPMGAVTIMVHTPAHEDLAQRFESTIASAFNDLEPDIATQTGKTLQRGKLYVGSTPAHIISGLSFLEVVNKKDVESIVFSQRHPSITHLTVITELPDEAVDDGQLALCIRAHRAQHEGVIRAVLEELKRQGKQVDLQ